MLLVSIGPSTVLGEHMRHGAKIMLRHDGQLHAGGQLLCIYSEAHRAYDIQI